MSKLNCWEFMECGREPGGSKVSELGECPAATYTETDGFCDGKNAGRSCMFITGTLCAGTIQGTPKDKSKKCMDCKFFNILRSEEGSKISIFSFNDYMSGDK